MGVKAGEGAPLVGLLVISTSGEPAEPLLLLEA
jgi:hypothetical protein